jgi:hypothetical protein
MASGRVPVPQPTVSQAESAHTPRGQCALALCSEVFRAHLWDLRPEAVRQDKPS